MFIKEISYEEFNAFSLNHKLKNFYQSLNYALVMSEMGYDYEFIGYTDGEEICAASLILYKKLDMAYYGYAPRGFLIDYKNKTLLKNFTNDLKTYYYNKNFAFIKINPNIYIGEINKFFELKTNENYVIKSNLTDSGYQKLKDNLYFESALPRFSPLIDLHSYKTSNLSKNTRNKIKKGIRKGLIFEENTLENISALDNLIHSKTFYYADLLSTFGKTNQAKLFTVYIDNFKYLENSQRFYINQSEVNQELNDKMVKISHSKNINKKMNSDFALLSYKKDMMEATKLAEKNEKKIIAAALVVNYQNESTIIASGYDPSYKRFSPNYFLHYNIIKYCRRISHTLNINGISGDFSKESKYDGLNKFKMGFGPTLYENAGEYDLIINEKAYRYLLRTKLVQDEFSKKL